MKRSIGTAFRRSRRFIAGGLLLAGCIFWMNQNDMFGRAALDRGSAAIGRALISAVKLRDASELKNADPRLLINNVANPRPIELSFLPGRLGHISLNGFDLGIAGSILVVSSLFRWWWLGPIAVVAALTPLSCGWLKDFLPPMPYPAEEIGIALAVGLLAFGVVFGICLDIQRRFLPRDELDRLRSTLRSRNAGSRCIATSQLAYIERPARAVEPLVDVLTDRDRDVRMKAVEALVRIGDRRAVKPLAAALRDKDEYVQKSAAAALGTLGDRRAVKPLVAALRDKNENVRASAADALGPLGDRRAVKALVAALRDKNKDVRASAAAALGRLGNRRAVKPLVAAFKAARKGSDTGMQVTIIDALRELADPLAVETLLDAIQDRSDWVRAKAVWALGGLRDGRIAEALVTAIKDRSAEVRCYAVHLLRENGDPSCLDAIAAALDDRDESVRNAAIDVLGELGDPRVVKRLIGRFQPDGIWAKTALRQLECVLERVGAQVTTDDLKALTALTSVSVKEWEQTGGCPDEGEYYRHELDCTLVKQLARQELIRRGILA